MGDIKGDTYLSFAARPMQLRLISVSHSIYRRRLQSPKDILTASQPPDQHG